MTKGISKSRFNMWRSVVAMAHADGVVTPHEVSFINSSIRDIDLSKEQLDIIGQDLFKPKDIYKMFLSIDDLQDKKDFFALARALSWCDGDYAAQERKIIEQLEGLNLLEGNEALLTESRDILNEVDLQQNQWHFKTQRSRDLFQFLNVLKDKAA